MKITMEFSKPGEIKILFQDAGSEVQAIVQQGKNGIWKLNTKGIEEESFIGLVIPDLVMGNAIAVARAYEIFKEGHPGTISEKLSEDLLEELSCYLD